LISRLLRHSGPVGVLLCLLLLGLAWLSLSRGALLYLYWTRVDDVPALWRLFPIGIRMDLIVLCELLAIPAILYFFLPGQRVRNRVSLILFTLVAVLVLHMELSTPPFVDQYQSRPNRIYFEYLLYPKEVFGTLLKQYPLQLLGVTTIVAALSAGFYALIGKQMERAQPWSWRTRALVFPLVLTLMFLGARSTLGHRPANLSTASFSHNHLANELAVSSTYTLLNAIYLEWKEVGAEMYGAMPWPEVERRVARYRTQSLAMETPPSRPFLPVSIPGRLPKAPEQRPPNLVVVVLESLGAGFVGSLGGLPLTPNLDRLSNEGLWFTQLYATGTRTVRGLEAIVTAFPPTAAQSVLKRPEAQRDFFTLAALLKNEGYRTDFIYGGVSNFDNMGRFFHQNGFERIIEEKHFKKPAFRGTWGVSDEDLVTKAHETFLAHGDKPFFALMLSTSNHDPFEFPEGRIDLYEQPAATRNNAVKYTDYAVGKLIELARSAPYGQHTLFLIVADHDARVFGEDLVPIERFRVPGLLLGPGVPARHEDRIVSQIDLAPTLLSLMGIRRKTPMIGRDLFATPREIPGRAMMQYDNTNAFRVGNKVVIQRPHQPARTYAYADGQLTPGSSEPELEKDALAHLLWAETMYRERRYRLQ
jgi:phosphoglycerol transferase MdoB-like AlkP superfamily enzyme